MADPEYLKILKQGAEVWNRWRNQNQMVQPDLREASLAAAALDHANLRSVNLSNADLSGAQLSAADLCGANLMAAGLSRANLFKANLESVSLINANLSAANLNGADLTGADLFDSQMYLTNINNVDLRQPKGLDSVLHRGPSSIGVDTLTKSLGRIPDSFLRGCGLSDWEISAAKLWNPDLAEDERTAITYEILRIQGERAIQVNPLFVSYSHADAPFLENLKPHFDQRGIRYWRDVHDMKAGRMETQIDRAIRLNPTVLLVLSENSVESDWVEWESAKARELEKELGRDVLCPVALDEAWKTCSWPGPLRRQIEDYHILDFSGWRDTATLERQFGKLLDGLSLFYKPKEES